MRAIPDLNDQQKNIGFAQYGFPLAESHHGRERGGPVWLQDRLGEDVVVEKWTPGHPFVEHKPLKLQIRRPWVLDDSAGAATYSLLWVDAYDAKDPVWVYEDQLNVKKPYLIAAWGPGPVFLFTGDMFSDAMISEAQNRQLFEMLLDAVQDIADKRKLTDAGQVFRLNRRRQAAAVPEMTNERTIIIAGNVYRKNPEVDRYQIPFDKMGELRMNEVPAHSHLEVLGLPAPKGVYEMECYALNGGEEGEAEYLEVYGGASFKVTADDLPQVLSRLRRAFPDLDPPGQQSLLRNPLITSENTDDGLLAHVFLNLKYKDKPETLVRDAVAPFIEGYRRFDRGSVHVFVCHASEDKPAARELASAMTKLGADVWFDEWEIRVGDSIVQKIGAGLGTLTHLVILLSKNSVDKPWVQKELSSALMRQLSEKAVDVLPVRLDDCLIPPILADIKYADARGGIARALLDLEPALFKDS